MKTTINLLTGLALVFVTQMASAETVSYYQCTMGTVNGSTACKCNSGDSIDPNGLCTHVAARIPIFDRWGRTETGCKTGGGVWDAGKCFQGKGVQK